MPGISIKIDGDVKGLTSSLDEAVKATTGFSVPAIAGIAGVAGAAVFAAGKVAEFTQAAAEDRAEQEKLETVYKNTGAAVGDYTTQIDAAIKAGADKAFSDSEVRSGLQSLVTATGDAQKANELLATAMDVARFANVDLETASNAVSKAYAGQDTQLAKLMPGLKKGTDAFGTIKNAQDLAKGSADDYANSAEGMGKRGSDAFGELTESIGAAFLPVLDELLPALIPIIETLGEIISLIVPILVPAIKLLVQVLKIGIDAFKAVLDVIKQVVQWIQQLIDWLGKIKIPDLSGITNIKLPFLSSAATSVSGLQAEGVSARTVAPATVGNVIINISGDPAVIEREVLRALRSYGRRNGQAIAGIT